MSLWPVFLTAPKTDFKTLNKLWIHLQDYEFTKGNEDGSWTLLTSAKLREISLKCPRILPKTDLPSDEDEDNFIGWSLTKINNFVRENEDKLKEMGITSSNWIIVDEEALQSFKVLLIEQPYDEAKEEMSKDFQAIRIPALHAWVMFANMDTANMDFDEFINEDAGVQEDGAYLWKPFDGHEDEEEEESVGAEREKAMKKAKDDGLID